MNLWTTEDQKKARHEGWMFLFGRIMWEGAARGKPPLRNAVKKTQAVRRYVERRAAEGSDLHRRALAEEARCRLTSEGTLNALTYD